MKEKLTLSIDRETKQRAKKHAKAVGKSISEMVESFLNEVSAEAGWEPPEGSITCKLMGSIPDIDPRDYDAIIAEERTKRYEKNSD